MGFNSRRHLLAACLSAGTVFSGAAAASAHDDALDAPPGSRVTGSISFDYYTHFVLYGVDVWGGGNDFGDDATFNPAASLNIALSDDMNLFMGAWADVNDNAVSGIGGQLQEVDVWVGVDYTIHEWTFSLTGQQWVYGGGVESVIDFGIAYDDSALWGDSGIPALNPSLIIHYSNDFDGFAYVFGIAPGLTLNEGGAYPVEVTFPINVGFGDSDFYMESGYAFASAGAQFSIPLSALIDESYGAWAFNFGLTYYTTDDDATGNPDDDFFVGNVGLSMSF